MRVLFTCGGTAGHINPALALARLLQQREPSTELLFVGAEGGMECQLVAHEGYDLRTVTVSSFYRSLSMKSLRHNLHSLRVLPLARRQAAAILSDFQPDLVVGTGGYASYPVAREAARRGIPTAVHESNAVPGLTTKALAKTAGKIMVGYEESRAFYPDPTRVVVTGTPVRGDFFALTRAEARAKLGLADDLPLVLSYWGSLGAEGMNAQMVEFIAAELKDAPPFHHLHGAGRGYERLTEHLAEKGLDLAQSKNVEVRAYIYDMNVAMAAADLVICRAGASTLSELTALAKPAILVPSPHVTNHHQERNAGVLAAAGGALVLQEAACSGALLYLEAKKLLADRPLREQMAASLKRLAVPDAAEAIYEVLMGLVK